MSVRRHVEHAEPLDERLVQEALRLKEEAKRLGPGKRRQEMLRRARKAEVAASIVCWITSPGLPPPE
jgi:hypothetical protein